MSQGTIILLNGASSSGKTTLALALQDRLERPYFHIAQDMFNRMAPRTYRNTDFWSMTATSISAMHHTIALFSDLGLNVIVDHVLTDAAEVQAWLPEAVRLLHAHPVLFVRVWCPAEELDRREQARGDRRPGQGRAQLEHMHHHGVYDLSVDTYQFTTVECADSIVQALEQPERWTAFRTLHERWT